MASKTIGIGLVVYHMHHLWKQSINGTSVHYLFKPVVLVSWWDNQLPTDSKSLGTQHHITCVLATSVQVAFRQDVWSGINLPSPTGHLYP